MDAGKKEFRKFAGLIKLEKIEVYGEISDSVLKRLHKKAQDLGKGTVAVHDYISGFWRQSWNLWRESSTLPFICK